MKFSCLLVALLGLAILQATSPPVNAETDEEKKEREEKEAAEKEAADKAAADKAAADEAARKKAEEDAAKAASNPLSIVTDLVGKFGGGAGSLTNILTGLIPSTQGEAKSENPITGLLGTVTGLLNGILGGGISGGHETPHHNRAEIIKLLILLITKLKQHAPNPIVLPPIKIPEYRIIEKPGKEIIKYYPAPQPPPPPQYVQEPPPQYEPPPPQPHIQYETHLPHYREDYQQIEFPHRRHRHRYPGLDSYEYGLGFGGKANYGNYEREEVRGGGRFGPGFVDGRFSAAPGREYLQGPEGQEGASGQVEGQTQEGDEGQRGKLDLSKIFNNLKQEVGQAVGTAGEGERTPGAAEGQPPGTVEGQPPGTVEGQPPGTVEGQPPGTVEGQPPGTVEGQPPGTVEGPPPGAAEDQPPGGAPTND